MFYSLTGLAPYQPLDGDYRARRILSLSRTHSNGQGNGQRRRPFRERVYFSTTVFAAESTATPRAVSHDVKRYSTTSPFFRPPAT